MRQILFFIVFSAPAMLATAQKTRPAEEQVLAEKVFIEASRDRALGRYDEAIYLFTEVLRKDNGNHAAHFELAKLYSVQNQTAKALENGQKAVELSPKNIFYCDYYASLLEKSGKFKEATELYERLVKDFPKTDSLQFRLAYYYQKSGKPEQAIKVYNNLESRVGVSKEISLNKYYAYAGLKKVSKAAAELEALIKAYPRDTHPYELLASYYEQNKMTEEAFSTCERLLAAFPDNPRANLRMAQYYKARGDEAKYLGTLTKLFDDPAFGIEDKLRAISPYLADLDKVQDPATRATLLSLGSKAVAAHPSDASAHAMYAELLSHFGDDATAFSEYKKNLDLNPNKRDVWQNYLQLGAALGKNEELLKGSQDAMDLFPNDPLGYFYHGMALSKKGKYDDALADLQQAQMMSGSNPKMKSDVLGVVGGVHSRKGNYAKADESFARALELTPDSYVALHEYSLSLAQRGQDFDKASQMMQKANGLKSNNLMLESGYAWVLYKAKDYKESKKWFEKAFTHGGDQQAEVLERYGDLLYRMNQVDEAVTYWQKALEKGGKQEVLNKKVQTKNIGE